MRASRIDGSLSTTKTVSRFARSCSKPPINSLFRSVGLGVKTFTSAQDFLASKCPDAPSCLVLDVQLPGLSGLGLQQELAMANIRIPIIFITGHGDIPTSVRAMKAGAAEFLPSPFAIRT
jgi:FixJ family two-component response regulator